MLTARIVFRTSDYEVLLGPNVVTEITLVFADARPGQACPGIAATD